MRVKSIFSSLGLFVGALSLSATTLHAKDLADHAENAMDFSSLKAKCLELSSNQQLKPFKAIVSCKEVSYVWREAKEQTRKTLQNSRQIGSSIRMKGFETPEQEVGVPIEDSNARCTVMEKWKRTVPSVDAELSCDELNNVADLTQYCFHQVTQRVEEDSSLAVEEATGERLDTCTKGVSQLSSGQQQERRRLGNWTVGSNPTLSAKWLELRVPFGGYGMETR